MDKQVVLLTIWAGSGRNPTASESKRYLVAISMPIKLYKTNPTNSQLIGSGPPGLSKMDMSVWTVRNIGGSELSIREAENCPVPSRKAHTTFRTQSTVLVAKTSIQEINENPLLANRMEPMMTASDITQAVKKFRQE
jgi:hypothetical protein